MDHEAFGDGQSDDNQNYPKKPQYYQATSEQVPSIGPNESLEYNPGQFYKVRGG
jgi:hypothetical protein